VAEPGETRCVACGARFRPLPFRGFAYLVLVSVLLGLMAVAAVGLWSAADDQGEAEAAKDALSATTTVPTTVVTAPPVTAPPTPVDVKASSIVASAQSGTSRNNCGEVTSYDVANVQDVDWNTAWRVKGDGTGQTVTLTLPGPTRLTQVGLLPGYAKVDPCNGAARFPQLRRITKVAWIFQDGSRVEQAFAELPETQMMPVDVVTNVVTVEIAGTTPPGSIDYTPISEIRLIGWPAA
jgi:hypothetical protein